MEQYVICRRGVGKRCFVEKLKEENMAKFTEEFISRVRIIVRAEAARTFGKCILTVRSTDLQPDKDAFDITVRVVNPDTKLVQLKQRCEEFAKEMSNSLTSMLPSYTHASDVGSIIVMHDVRSPLWCMVPETDVIFHIERLAIDYGGYGSKDRTMTAKYLTKAEFEEKLKEATEDKNMPYYVGKNTTEISAYEMEQMHIQQANNTLFALGITKVIFNDQATIVFSKIMSAMLSVSHISAKWLLSVLRVMRILKKQPLLSLL